MGLADKKVIAAIFTVGYGALILPLTEHVAFTPPSTRHGSIVSYGLKLLFAIALYAATYFCLSVIEKLRAHDADTMSWLKFSAIYFAILIGFFLLIYPGHWVGDEFNILAVVKQYDLYSWQNYFTNIFYTFCLYLVPTGVSIVLFQIAIISAIVGYVTSTARKLLANPKLAYWLFIPFLLPPVILNNLYPLRAALYSSLELLIIALILFRYYGLLKKVSIYQELVLLATLIMLVSFWRSEGIYYLALFPILVVGYRVFSRQNLRKATPYVTVLACLSILLFGYLVTKETSNPQYELTAEINPLSTMLQYPLKGDHIDQRLAQINQVVDVKMVKQYPSYTEIPSFWKGAVRNDFVAHVAGFRNQYLYLVFHNLNLFVDNRVKTYLSTNTFYGNTPATLGPLDEDDYMQNSTAATFTQQNALSRPLNTGLKRRVSDLLLCQHSNGTYIFCAHLLWNSIIPLVGLIGLGIFNLIRRRYIWVGVIILVLLRVPLLFLTAPANYFFYYLPIYLIGYFLIALWLVLYFDQRGIHIFASHSRRRRASAAVNSTSD